MNKVKNVFLILVVLILLTFCTAITIMPINHITTNSTDTVPAGNVDAAAEVKSRNLPIHQLKKIKKSDKWPMTTPSGDHRCTDCEFEPMHFTITP